jgi:ABC-type multidrug transport system ATPase subunit
MEIFARHKFLALGFPFCKSHFLAMPDSVIQLQNIQRSFGKKRVLETVSLQLGPSSVFGLVGLNGAGKTTLIRILLGLLRPDSGQCLVLGSNPWKHESELYRRTGVVLEHNGFWGNLTVMQNITFFARARGICEPALDEYIREYWGDEPILHKKQKVKYFSRGEKMQCALCRAFLGWPKLYLLDEPVVALDVKAYDHFCSLVRRARQNGAAVLISSHQLDAIEDLCDSVGILENGTLALLDTSESQMQQWLIKAGSNPEYGEAILQVAGNKATYKKGAWHFELPSGNTTIIPAIISRLAEEKCSIEEVRKEDMGFRESIRKYYRKGL